MQSNITDLANASSEESIEADQLRLVHKNIPTVLLAHSMACVPLAIVMWGAGLRSSVIAWLALHYSVILARLVHHYSFKPDHASAESVLSYGRTNLFFIAMAGGVWGLAGVLFFDSDLLAAYSFLILTQVCIISGSMNATSSIPPAYNVFATLTMSPVIVVTFLQDSAYFKSMSIGALIYLIITMYFSRNLSHAIRESLILKYQNMKLVKDLQTQTEFANKANDEKSRFLATASHDIRQPLHAANLFADAMEMEVNNNNQRYILGGIRRGLDTVSELFDALLDISSIDNKVTPVSKSDFNLSQQISYLLNGLKANAKQKNIMLRFYDCDYMVHCDRILLERILSNLILNAIHYTSEGEVTVYAEKANEHTLLLHIKDTGIGIKQEDQNSIFKEFVQLDNTERDRSKGLGLGLAIVHRLTTLLEIPLTLRSEINLGTDFILELPLSTAKPTEIRPTQHLPQNNRLDGLTILVVDNEIEIIKGLSLLLKNWGCKVMIAYTSIDAFEQASVSKPDFIISDFRMPGTLDGIDLINKIRATYPEIDGLIVSGDTGHEILAKSQKYNIMLLKKPVKPVQLNMAISRTVKH